MFVTGHIASAWLAARALDGSDPRGLTLGAALAGVLLPDLIDKTILVSGQSVWGRTVGHSVFLWLIAAFAALMFRGRDERRARQPGTPTNSLGRLALICAASGWLHLGIDLVNDTVAGVLYTGWMFSLWFTWPFFNPDCGMVATAPLVDAPGRMTPWEVGVVVMAVLWATLDARSRRSIVRDRAT